MFLPATIKFHFFFFFLFFCTGLCFDHLTRDDVALVRSFQLCSLTFEIERFGGKSESRQIISLGAEVVVLEGWGGAECKCCEALWLVMKQIVADNSGAKCGAGDPRYVRCK